MFFFSFFIARFLTVRVAFAIALSCYRDYATSSQCLSEVVKICAIYCLSVFLCDSICLRHFRTGIVVSLALRLCSYRHNYDGLVTWYGCLMLVFYEQLVANRHLPGGCVKRYRDSLKSNLKSCGIDMWELIDGPLNKSAWCSRPLDAVIDFEDRRVREA